MKQLSLTIGERLAAQKILKEFKGDVFDLKAVIEDVPQFPVTEEEWVAANLVKTPSDEDVKKMDPEAQKTVAQTWQWDEKAEKEINIGDATLKFLTVSIQQKSDSKEFTLEDRALLTLQDKLK